jgi:glycosyltransferase involved in cell wall biosynthesis
VVKLNVLYYGGSKTIPRSPVGGVLMVGHFLTKALTEKARLSYFPEYAPKTYGIEVAKLYANLALKNFDIVHFNYPPILANGSYPFFGVAKVTGTATLLNIHGIVQIEYMLDYPHNKQVRSFMEGIMMNTARACKQVDKIVTYSSFMRKQIVQWYRVREEKIAVIPNGIQIERFSKATNKKKLSGDPAILYLGYLSNFKGVDILIKSISKIRNQLPHLKLHLVGHGNIELFKTMAIQMHVEDSIVFHGYVKPEQAPLFYKLVDFCVFPSRRDSFGITLLEAMASGVPVLASNRGGTPEIITQFYNGLLFDPDFDSSLAESILLLSQDKRLRKTISGNALNTIKHYSWQNISEKYLLLYNELIKH